MSESTPILSTDQFIEQEKKKFNVTREFLTQKSNDYKGLVIAGPEDKTGYESVKKAVADLRTTRTSIEAKRKEIKDIALKFGKAIDQEAKELTAIIETTETDLKKKIDFIDNEKQRLKEESERKALELFNSRVNELFSIGFALRFDKYELGKLSISAEIIQHSTDEQWQSIILSSKIIADEIRIEKEKTEDLLRKMRESQIEDKSDPVVNEPVKSHVQPQTSKTIESASSTVNQSTPVQAPPTAAPSTTNDLNHPLYKHLSPIYIKAHSAGKLDGYKQYDSGVKNGAIIVINEMVAMLSSDEKFTRAQIIDRLKSMLP